MRAAKYGNQEKRQTLKSCYIIIYCSQTWEVSFLYLGHTCSLSAPKQAPKQSLLLLQTYCSCSIIWCPPVPKTKPVQACMSHAGTRNFLWRVTKIHIHSRNSFILHVKRCTDYEIISFEFTVFIRIYDQNAFLTKICIEQTRETFINCSTWQFLLGGRSSKSLGLLSRTFQTNTSRSITTTVWFLKLKHILPSTKIWRNTVLKMCL